MIDDRAKQMVESREELARVLVDCATALAQTANTLAASCQVLQQAALAEQEATLTYITALEAELSQQRALS